MARREIVELIDDLDDSKADETVTFGIDGVQYEIELSTKNANKLRQALQPYVDAGRKVSSSSRTAARPARRGAAAAATRANDPEQNRAMREWAKSKKMEISDRGRIPAHIVEAYHTSAGR
jgi:uncharacterized membrane protein